MANSFEPNGNPTTPLAVTELADFPATPILNTPSTFYSDPSLTAEDRTLFSSTASPLTGLQIQENFLELGLAAVDLSARAQIVEAWPQDIGSVAAGFVNYNGALEHVGRMYGGNPYSITSSSNVTLPVSGAFKVYISEGVGAQAPRVYHLCEVTSTAATTADLVADLNDALTYSNGGVREYARTADSAPPQLPSAVSAGSFKVVFDDDSEVEYTVDVASAASLALLVGEINYGLLHASPEGISSKLTAVEDSGKVKFVGVNSGIESTRITLSEDSGTYLVANLGFTSAPVIFFDFSTVLEFTPYTATPTNPDKIIFRGTGKGDSYAIYDDLSNGLFHKINIASISTTSGSPSTFTHALRPVTAYSSYSCNIGSAIYGESFNATNALTGASLSAPSISGTTLSVSGATTTGSLVVTGGAVTSSAATSSLFANNTVTTLSIGSYATTLSIGAATGTTTIENALTVDGISTLTGAVTTAAALTVGTDLAVGGNVAIDGYASLTDYTDVRAAGANKVLYAGMAFAPNNTGTAADADYLNFNGVLRGYRLLGVAIGQAGTTALTSTTTGEIIITPSDERLKTNVQDIYYGLSTVAQLRPISFNWRDPLTFGPQTELGFLAQDVKDCIPELVGGSEDMYYTMDYAKLTTVLVKAIQELNRKVEDLESKVLHLQLI